MAVSLKLGRLGIELVLDADDFKSGIKGVLKSMKTLSKVGAVVGAGMAAGIGFAIKSFADLEQAVTNAAAVTGGDFKRNFELFKAAAMDAAAGTLFSAKESGQALEYLARAGLTAGQAVAALKPVLQFATAGNMDLAAATDIATDIMTAFRLKVEQLPALLDQLTYTSATSNTNIRMLGEAMKYVAPVAASMGQSTSDINAMLGKLASAGIKASQAGTSLRMMMVRMVRPMKTTGAAMKQLGTSMFDASGNFRSMIDVIGDLEKAQKTLSKQDFSAALARMFGSEALPAVNALLAESSSKLRDYSKDIAGATGKTKQMADLMANTVHGQFKIFKGNVSTLGAQIGSMLLPVLKGLNSWLIATVNSVLKSDAAFENFKSALVIVADVSIGAIKAFTMLAKLAIYVGGVIGEVVKGLGLMKMGVEAIAIAAAGAYMMVEDPKNAAQHIQRTRAMLDGVQNRADKLAKTNPWGTASKAATLLEKSSDALVKRLEEGVKQMRNLKRETVKAAVVGNAIAKGLPGPKAPTKPGSTAGKSAGKAPALSAIDQTLAQLDGKLHVEVRFKNKDSKLKDVAKELDAAMMAPYIEARKEMKERSRKMQIVMDASKDTAVSMFRTIGDAFGMGDGALGRAAMGLVDQLQSAQDPLQALAMMGRSWAQGIIGVVAEHEKTQQHLRVLKTAVSDLGIPDVLGGFLGAMEPAIGAIIAVTRALKPIGDMVDSGPLKEFLAGGFLKGVKVFVGVVLGLAEGVQMVSHTIANVAYKIVQGMYILVGGINKVINNIGLSIDIKPLQEATRRAKENVDRIASVGSAIDKAQEALADATIASGQAIYDEVKNRDKLNETLKESIRNAPAGFKVSLARYRATNRAGMGMLEGTGMRQQAVTINGNVYVDGGNKDGETLWKEMARMNFLKSGSQQATYTQVVAAKTRSFAQWG